MLQETLEFVQHLSDYVDGVTDKPPTPSLKKGVLVDIRLTREIEKWYKHERDNNTHCYLAIRLRAVSLFLENCREERQTSAPLARHAAHGHARTLTCSSFFPMDFQGRETVRSLPHYQSESYCTTLRMKMNLICVMKSYFISGHQNRFENDG